MDLISLENNGKFFFIIQMVIVLFQNLNAHHHNEIHYYVQLSQTNKICRWNSLNIMGPHSFNANEKPCTLTIKANTTWIALIRWHSWIVFIHRKLVTCNDKSLIYFGVEIIWTKSLVANIKGVKMAAPSWWVVLGRTYFLVLHSREVLDVTSLSVPLPWNSVPEAHTGCWIQLYTLQGCHASLPWKQHLKTHLQTGERRWSWIEADPTAEASPPSTHTRVQREVQLLLLLLSSSH